MKESTLLEDGTCSLPRHQLKPSRSNSGSARRTLLLRRLAFLITGLVMLESLRKFGPSLTPAHSQHPAFLVDFEPWRTYCGASYADQHYAYRSRPKTPGLTFPSWGTYEPISPLRYDDPAWPYGDSRVVPELASAEGIEPVGVFIGIITVPAATSRRQVIRETNGRMVKRAVGDSLSGVKYKFVLGRPSSTAELDQLLAENETFSDVVILPIEEGEDQNHGKIHAFYKWAAEEARVPDCRYANATAVGANSRTPWKGVCTGERQPDYVVNADDDSFVVLEELERRLRILPRTKAWWGRLVKGHGGLLVKGDFLTGLLQATSFDLVQFIAASPYAQSHKIGAEDQLVGDWMRAHPAAETIAWVEENCWTYDHPRAMQYHGFIFSDIVQAIKAKNDSQYLPEWVPIDQRPSWSTTSPKHKNYSPIPGVTLSPEEVIESLIEGSPLSQLHSHNRNDTLQASAIQRSVQEAYSQRVSWEGRMQGWSEGSTVVVHSMKKDELWAETEAALFGGQTS